MTSNTNSTNIVMTSQQAEDMLQLQQRLAELKQNKKAVELQIKVLEGKLSTEYHEVAEAQFQTQKSIVKINPETLKTTTFNIEQNTTNKRVFIDNPVELAESLELNDLVSKSVKLGDVDKIKHPEIKAKFDAIISNTRIHSYKVVKV